MENLKAALGSHVEIELVTKTGGRERMAFDLVGDEAADFERGLLGVGTPLAQALLDQPAGVTLPYQRGDIVQVHLLAVQPGGTESPPDTSQEREALLRRARDKSDLANAITYALTFDSKWGDADPEGIEKNWRREDEKTDQDEGKARGG